MWWARGVDRRKIRFTLKFNGIPQKYMVNTTGFTWLFETIEYRTYKVKMFICYEKMNILKAHESLMFRGSESCFLLK